MSFEPLRAVTASRVFEVVQFILQLATLARQHTVDAVGFVDR